MEPTLILYGERQLHFDPDEHRYWLDGEELISVTKYLKLAGYQRPYFGDGTAAIRGRFVHEATRYLDFGRLDLARLDPQLAGYVDGWRKFKAERRFVPDLALRERPLFHPVYRYAGTPDAPGALDGQPAVVEIKTGTTERWHALQNGGGYVPALAALEPTYLNALNVVVYLAENGSYDAVVVRDKRLPHLFASIVAVVNGRAVYGNAAGG